MRIVVHFQLYDQNTPAAVTGVSGPITDFLLPSVGDMVRHCDDHGAVFTGRITDRLYSYDITGGVNVNGAVTVTLSMDRIMAH